MKLIINAICDKGNVRIKNEDMICVANDIFRNDSKHYEIELESSEFPILIAVADGMGGHKGGEYASEFVISEMNNSIFDLRNQICNENIRNYFKERITAIHQRLLDEGSQEAEKMGMGSTFIGLIFFRDSVYLINVGDSRFYRFRQGILSQLSRDHSLSEMTNNPSAPKNVIVNSFGGGKSIFFDFEDISKRIMHDDKILLCSDGLNTEIDDDLIEKMMDKDNASILVESAKSNGGKDNISVITIHCKNEK
jgi:serine/threonine protein phosphatase PrpC